MALDITKDENMRAVVQGLDDRQYAGARAKGTVTFHSAVGLVHVHSNNG